MKLKHLLAFLVVVYFPAYSQSANINSLTLQLPLVKVNELISSLCFLGEHLLDSIPEESYHYYKRANDLADSLQNIEGKKLALYSLGNYYKRTGEFKIAKNYFDSSKLLTPTNDFLHRILILIGYGEINYEILQYDSAILFLENAKNLAEKQNNFKTLSAIYNNLAKANDKLGKRDEAIEYYVKAARIFEKSNDYKNLSIAYNNLGTVNLSFQNYKEALHFFFEALKLNSRDGLGKNLSMIYSNIGVAYYKSDSLEKAAYYHRKSLNISKQKGDVADMARSFLNLANLYSHQKKFDLAIAYYDSSLKICQNLGLEYGILLNKINLGELYYNRGNYRIAAETMENALKLLSVYSLPEEKTELYRMLYKTYLKLGNETLALKNLEKHYNLRDSIAGEKKNQVLLELQAKYENEKKQKELTELQKEKLANEGKYRVFIIVFLIFIMAFLLFSFFIIFQRRRAIFHKKLAEKDNEILKSQMNTKDKELANFAMHLAKNYEFNANISTEINKIMPLSDKTKTEKLSRIIHNLDSESNVDAWKEFELRFEQVHKDFFGVLKELHPDLTPVEIKVCSLLRLNMSSKDISALTNRSVRTIENTRTSIRKKLKLHPQTNLLSYLLSI
ncbi:MAG: tetratricopeptide repeat protein [Bacteroidales bacterium]|nr:tetratricopeptide repeat protein [Bacteroidales bacterium]